MKRIIQLAVHALGIIIIGASLYYVVNSEAQLQKGEVIHLPSLALVVFVLIGIILASYQITHLFKLVKNLVMVSPAVLESQLTELGKHLEEMSDIYYGQGTSALKQYVQKKKLPPVWKSVVAQLEAKMPARDIRMLLKYDSKNFEDEVNSQISILSALSSIAPSVGVLGTVLGLIKLMADLNDFASLGPNMSLALITTLYGVFFSIIVFNPMTTRLEHVKETKLKFYHQAMFWISLIENQKPSFYSDPKFLAANE